MGGPGREGDIGEVDIGGQVISLVMVPGGLGCTSDAALEGSRLCIQKGDNYMVSVVVTFRSSIGTENRCRILTCS